MTKHEDFHNNFDTTTLDFPLILASLAGVLTLSVVLLSLCVWCRKYSMDLLNYDKDDAQVISNTSAGAKELPSVYTIGAYSVNNEYTGVQGVYGGVRNDSRHTTQLDTVYANPNTLGSDNGGFSMTPAKENSQRFDDFVILNPGFAEQSP